MKYDCSSCLSKADSILLHPSLRLGIAVTNKKTGSSLGEKSVSVSGCATLFQTIGFLLALFLALRALCMIFRARRCLMMKTRKKRPDKEKIMSDL